MPRATHRIAGTGWLSGAVRICKWMADGRRHIAEFCFSGDCFGLPASGSGGYGGGDRGCRGHALPAACRRPPDR